jgi:hypothetical protein
MVRPVTALLLSCLLFTGCASRGGRIAAGAATMMVGGMFAATPGETTTHHPTCNPSPCPGAVDALFTHDTTDPTPQIVGGLMLVTGAVLLIAGLVTHDAPERQAPMQPAMQPVAYAPPPPQPMLPSERLAMQAQAEATAVPRPAQAAIVGRIENRLAIQASMAAHAGHCSSAVITANKLAELDAELHVSLLERDTELALCYATTH